MQVRLSNKLQRFVRQLIAEGQFSTADEVISTALTAFARAELRREAALADKAVRAGDVADWDVNEFKRDLMADLKKNKKKAS
jgi:putative addiction module CopG family antidote